MRRTWLAVCLLIAAAVPTASAEPTPLSFIDALGDVTQDGETATGGLADGTDIVAVGLAESDELTFTLELADIDGLQEDISDTSLHAQYAVSFDTPTDEFSMRATLASPERALGDVGWRFQIHDRGADEWTMAQGRVDGDTLVWTVPLEDLSLSAGDRLDQWSVSAWTSQDDEPQINDWASTGLVYEIGAGVLPGVVPEGVTVLLDMAGDVTSGSDAYDGPGAASTDILAGRAWLTDDGIQFELDLDDLDALEEEDGSPGFHAQYAFTFHTDGDRAWSTRATYWDTSGWSFSLHDQQADEWPEVMGQIRDDTIVWRVPQDMLGVGPGDTLSSWSVNTWNSADDADQYGDSAEGAAAMVLGEPVAAIPFHAPGIVLTDGSDDLTSRGEPYTGDGAPGIDILEGRIMHTTAGLQFELDVVDLSALEVEKDEPDFHAQYAFSFLTGEGHDGWSMRASYAGSDRTQGNPWSFQVHDREADQWTDVGVTIRGDTLVWVIPLDTFGLEVGDEMWGWDASTWSSFDDRDQYGDGASSAVVYTIGDPEVAALGSSLDAFIPAPGAVALLALLALAVLRRR